jgi:hypothetical protein
MWELMRLGVRGGTVCSFYAVGAHLTVGQRRWHAGGLWPLHSGQGQPRRSHGRFPWPSR